MTVLASYSDLTAEMALWLNRSDLTDRIPSFIRLFEARMNRRLRAPDMEITVTQDVAQGTDTYALNSRIRSLRMAYLSTDPITVLQAMTPEVLKSTYPNSTQDQPYAYTLSAENIILGPVPDAAYTLVYSGFATLSGLDSGNATNWLLDDHPDLYLFGSLARAEAYLKDDQRVAVWKAAEDEALAEIIREANEKRLPAGPLQMQPTVWE